jgi:short subunit dehydrogenase-like uncharacterized protein
MNEFLLYGATGYTGRRIAEQAVQYGLRPILAGRSREPLQKIAATLNCEARVFGLEDADEVAAQLRGVSIVLNCAGPFSQTARPLVAGCVAAHSHYLDITGEIEAIEFAASQDTAARTAGITVMPSVGFDVVPTDCIAALLKEALPDATHLALAFHSNGSVSPGTAKTAIEGAIVGGRARVDGEIVRVRFGSKSRTIPFADGPQQAQVIPWGDVASAFYTTGIPNIEVYAAMDELGRGRMRRLNRVRWLLRLPGVLRVVQGLIARKIPGPTDAELRAGRTELWGEVRNAAGRTASLTMTTPNGYQLTIHSALAAVERVRKGGVAVGFQTPARALGKEFAASLGGVTVSPITRS